MEAQGTTTPFRRATEADAVELALEIFQADERVDMNALAGRLGVSRATLHRWVQTRENLLNQVLGRIAQDYFEDAVVRARRQPDDAVAVLAQTMVSASSGSAALRGFTRREPELALRLFLSEEGQVRRRVRDGIQALVESVYPDEAAGLTGFSEAVTHVGVAIEWATIAGGGDPDADRIAQLVRALLAGARAGELPPSGAR